MGKEGEGSRKQVVPIFEDLVEATMQAAAEGGAQDEHRALSYLVSSYPTIYVKAAEAYKRNFLAAELEIRPSDVKDDRKIMDVIFSFTNYETNVIEKYHVNVDVARESPTLVTDWAEYHDI